MINKNTAAVLLSKLFLKEIRRFESEGDQIKGDVAYKYALINDAYNVLSEVDYEEVKKEILTYSGQKTSYYNISSFLDIKPRNYRGREELIRLGDYYLHPELQESPRPGRVFIDYETMETKRAPAKEFYLEIKETYTIDDLAGYYLKKHNLEYRYLPTGYKTQFYNLLNNYSLDYVLYMIDSSASNKHDSEEGNFARSPAFLSEYIEDAEQRVNYRKNVLTEGGLTKVVPRKIY